MDRIHFGARRKPQRLEVLIGAADKNRAVCDLCFMALAGLELHFAFQVDVTRCDFVRLTPDLESESFSRYLRSADRALYVYLWAIEAYSEQRHKNSL